MTQAEREIIRRWTVSNLLARAALVARKEGKK